MYLLQIQNIGNSLLVSAISCVITLISGYIIIRERLLKSEIEIKTLEDRIIQGQLQITQQFTLQLDQVKEDVKEFKEINKETYKSLTENTAAIRELKGVLDILREQLINDNNHP